MKIIIYENRKSDPICLDASTPEKENAAFLELFNYLKDNWDCYCEIEDESTPKKQKEWYNKAVLGDAKAAKNLLTARRDYEYEEWKYSNVVSSIVDRRD